MKVTISTLSDEIFVLDVSEDLELENFKAFCQVESGCNAQDIILIFNGRPLMDGKKTLKDEGVADGDVIVLQTLVQPVAPPRIRAPEVPNVNPSIAQLDFSSIRVPDAVAGPSMGAGLPAGAPRPPPLAEDPKTVHDMLAANPDQLSLLRQNNPRLADAYISGNFDTFATVLKEQVEARVEKEKQRLRMLNSDPFDTEAQRLIAEEIRQNNIEANMEAAMEHLPETFGTVAMLYINCHVNGYPVKAFIDSGAQTTIMSAGCAERCNIMRLVDTRWAGIAKGVGVQRIIGRIHMVQIKIENDFLTSSFAVLQDQPMDMLLGLDMLRRHQCNIDLNENVLRIGTTGTVSRFLPESELPECARLSGTSEQQLDEDTARVRQQLEVQDQLNNANKENL